MILLTAALACCASLLFADDRNLLPKYGSMPKKAWQKAADRDFIAGINKDYHGDRKKASEDLAMCGWQYLAQGDHDDAMRRFNQSWLLNNKNGHAL